MFEFREWEPQTHLHPTLPDCTRNIVGKSRNYRDQLIITVQCETCLVTYTDLMILALHNVNHGDRSEHGYMTTALPYKRCGKCRQERKYA